MSEIYMERRAFDFFRDFPDVPELLRPTYSRFYDAGLLWVDPNVDTDGSWPGSLRWTAEGRGLRDVYEDMFPSKQINFFTVEGIKPFLPTGDLDDVTRRIFKWEHEMPGLIPPMGHPKSPALGGLRYAMAGCEVALDRLLETMKANRKRIGR